MPRRTHFRPYSLLAVALALLVLAGCGEDSAQKQARKAVQAHVRTLHGRAYEVDRARCTRNARIGFNAIPTKVYLCHVPTSGARCDSFSAVQRAGRFSVTLRKRDVDCVLPVG